VDLLRVGWVGLFACNIQTTQQVTSGLATSGRILRFHTLAFYSYVCAVDINTAGNSRFVQMGGLLRFHAVVFHSYFIYYWTLFHFQYAHLNKPAIR